MRPAGQLSTIVFSTPESLNAENAEKILGEDS